MTANSPISNSPATPLSRRDFLGLASRALLGLAGLLGLGGVLRFLSYQPEPAPQTVFDLGPAENYPLNSRTVFRPARAVLWRTEPGFTAYSLECPHLGCLVEPAEAGYTCPCHGSRFTMEGASVRGPADRPLRNLKLEINDAGNLILNITSE